MGNKLIRLALMICIMAACKKMDDYKEYAEPGEIRYPSTFDSLKVVPGKGRVMITGLLTSDPSVKKFKVFWNNGNDSLETVLTRSGKVDTIRQLIGSLPEGPMTFTVRTYDEAGNKSIPMIITGNVYGPSFQTSVDQRGNRAVLKTSFTMDGAAVINWANVDTYVGVLGMKINYFNAQDQPRELIVPAQLQDQQTTVPGVSIKKPITYTTLYLPDTVGIDTFTVTAKTLSSFTEVALLNATPPVANVSNDGSRWATPRDWNVNDAAKNHNGYGGTDLDSKKIYFEAGWGAGAIQNGKIYQVATLPPGKYSFEGSVDWYSLGSRNDVYLMAVPGNSGLPNVDNLNGSIAYKKLNNGDSNIKMEFELTEATTLSIGLLLYMNDDGEAIRFNHLKLYIVN